MSVMYVGKSRRQFNRQKLFVGNICSDAARRLENRLFLLNRGIKRRWLDLSSETQQRIPVPWMWKCWNILQVYKKVPRSEEANKTFVGWSKWEFKLSREHHRLVNGTHLNPGLADWLLKILRGLFCCCSQRLIHSSILRSPLHQPKMSDVAQQRARDAARRHRGCTHGRHCRIYRTISNTLSSAGWGEAFLGV